MDDNERSTAEQHASRSSSGDSPSVSTSELADELYTLERQTEDGWFKAEITELVPIAEGETIAITVNITATESVTWHLDKPAIWSEENLFVRLAEHYDYGASSINLLEGEFLSIRPTTDESEGIRDTTGRWELNDPGQSESNPTPESEASLIAVVREHLIDILAMAGVMGVILLFVWAIAIAMVPVRHEQMVTQTCILLWIISAVGIGLTDLDSDVEKSEEETESI